MRKYFVLIYFSVFCFHKSKSQGNLVPNPSFEDTVSCPQGFGTIPYSTGWLQFTGSPDYFNPCTTMNWGTPYNSAGYQLAFDGQAYAGEMTQCLPQLANGREHFGIQLTQLLAIGQKYFVSFKVSLANIFGNSCWSNKIGAKFTTFTMNAGYYNPILANNFAHVYSDSLLKDTSNWVTISGSFVADSAYKYVVLGNFFDDAHTDTMNCAGKSTSYVYFDSVSVRADTSEALQVEKITNLYNAKIYPNPTAGEFIISSDNGYDEINLTVEDISGKVVYSGKAIMENKQTKLNLDLENGIYLINIDNGDMKEIQKLIIAK